MYEVCLSTVFGCWEVELSCKGEERTWRWGVALASTPRSVRHDITRNGPVGVDLFKPTRLSIPASFKRAGLSRPNPTQHRLDLH
jgi:hypothetical protein